MNQKMLFVVMYRRLMRYVFVGDQPGTETTSLDPVEACQIINLNPGDTDELVSYLPTIKRFEQYHLSNFIEGN